MVRIFFFLLGFCLMVYSFSYIIMCLNVFSIGYNFSLFVYFISSNPSFYLGFVGFLMIILSIIVKGEKK